MIYDFATAGTDGESDEDLEEGFFTADPDPLANPEKNTDINSRTGSEELPECDQMAQEPQEDGGT
jgi:hypothetical protein